MRGQCRRQASALPRIALFACLLVGTAASNAVAAPPTDDRLDALLSKTEQQIAAGHATAPRNDNAVDTWLQVLSMSRADTPASLTAIQSFATNLRSRSASEMAAGKLTTSLEYSVFAGLAEDYLAHANDARPGTDADAAPTEHEPPTAPSAPAAGTIPPAAVAEPVAGAESGPPVSPSTPAAPGNVGTSQEATSSPAPLPDAPKSVGDTSAQQTDPRIPIARADAPAVDPAAGTSVAGAPGPVVRQDQAAAALYSARGDAMMAVKDISAARRLYELAADAGSAHAASALGTTYDPAGLRRLGAIGLRPNPGLAALWYRRAEALGDPDAEARLNSLAYEARP